ncbi:MAG: hypothetical protein FJ395_04940 [Verrucomicrobia bacterium]|nr:hypothetical protein [Verrucomicrobiota bacterium]
MAEPTQSSVPSLRQRRWKISVNILLQIVALLAVVVMANWLLSRHHPKRWDWTRSSYYKLSSKTEQVLKGLKDPLDIVVCIPTASSRDFIEKALQDTRSLLKEFENVGKSKIRVEFVDPQLDRNRGRQLAEKYKIDSPDQIIFASGGRSKLVKLDDTVDLEGGYMGSPRIRAFKGEGVFLSAIQSVTQEKPPKVYFLTGHGERDIESTDERNGYSVLAGYIKRDNIEVEKWNWAQKRTWPADASAIVIAGPQKRLTEGEFTALGEYLKNSGRVMMLLDYKVQTGLEVFLDRFGIQVDDNLAVMPLLGMINVTAMSEDYGRHPISEKLRGINTSFPYARSVRAKADPAMGGGERPDVTELVKTPDAFWGETDYKAQQIKFDPKADLRGPLSLAVAAETHKPGGVELNGMRLVVVGCSTFADNHNIRAHEGNVDLFMNSLNWLLKREQQIAVSPKTPQEFRLDMTPRQARAVYALVIGGMPLAVALLGLSVWVRRRK